MLRFIWNSWWRNKQRFILLLIGALIVSIGLSYLVGISQATNATVTEELQKRWKSSYDMVIRPPGSRSVTEDRNLLEPNYLSGLHEGISLDQYESIKNMEDIAIAAPISMIGYTMYGTTVKKVDYKEPGIYRFTRTHETSNGANVHKIEVDSYFAVGGGIDEPLAAYTREYGISRFSGELGSSIEVLIAAVDPEAEAALVGLDDSMITETDETNAFFEGSTEISKRDVGDGLVDNRIPVILSSKSFVDNSSSYKIARLNLPFGAEESQETVKKMEDNGGKAYLDDIEANVVDEFTFTSEDVHEQRIEMIKQNSSEVSSSDDFSWIVYKPTPVDYQEVTSPFNERWPYAYQVRPFTLPEESMHPVEHAYRPVEFFGKGNGASTRDMPRVRFDFKGVFDPSKLDISKDPLNELPMETYFPSTAKLVMDKNQQPVNPPTQLKPLDNPYGFLTKPPLMLTTLDAAAEILGEDPISSIRVKVAGVDVISEENEKKLNAIATKIEKETGLIVDITLGSSPQPAVTHIPASGEQPSIGWVEQPWIKLGSSITIFKESKFGLSNLIACVIAVAVVYVFSSNLIMMYARKKEFAVLLSLGWRPDKLSRMLMIEALILGVFVSMVSWSILGVIYATEDIQTSIARLIFIALFGLIIYLSGSVIPAILVRRISPTEAMKSGEVSKRKRRFVGSSSLIGMGINQMLTQWKRTCLSVISIALPTSMLIVLLFITFRLQGVMYTTWLGEFTAMEVGSMHYLAMGVALLIAILTTTEIMWQNVAERRPEFAVLKSLGWRNGTISRLIVWEGAANGIIAAVVGFTLAIGMIRLVYGQYPQDSWLFLSATTLIPIITGMIGALLPAIGAMRITPGQGFHGGISNSKRSEKIIRYVLGAGGAALSAGIVALLVFAIPDISNQSAKSETSDSTSVQGTSGDVEVFQDEKTKEDEEEVEDQNKEESINEDANAIDLLKETADTFKAGEEVVDPAKSFGDREVESSYHFTVEEVSPPEALAPEKDTNKLLSVKIEFTKTSTGRMNFIPNHFLVIDSKGEKYIRKTVNIIERGTWNSTVLIGETTFIGELTYEIPENVDEYVLYLDHETAGIYDPTVIEFN
ncbi:ABC transporter permease [Thalassobacillus hwangdonensis]|uniref:ABC transporter permease n=1 Tax=Thalassobacillus hwangdonensis TaxID=546108 RepID=A0ABW3KXT4_9BACI